MANNDINAEHLVDINERNIFQPLPIQIRVKQPKSFKFGDDIELFFKRFEIFCFSNKIPDKEKATILLSLFDDKTYQIISRLNIQDYEDFREVTTKIKDRFDALEGIYGYKLKLKNRKRQSNESITEFFEILFNLADKAGFNDLNRGAPIIEAFINNCQDDKLIKKAVKIQLKMQLKHRDDQEILAKITRKIKEYEKNQAILKLHDVKTSKSYLNSTTCCNCSKQNINYVSNNASKHSIQPYYPYNNFYTQSRPDNYQSPNLNNYVPNYNRQNYNNQRFVNRGKTTFPQFNQMGNNRFPNNYNSKPNYAWNNNYFSDSNQNSINYNEKSKFNNSNTNFHQNATHPQKNWQDRNLREKVSVNLTELPKGL